MLGALARQNFNEIDKLLSTIATAAYSTVVFDPSMYSPLLAYIQYAIPLFSDWVLEGQFMGTAPRRRADVKLPSRQRG